MMKKCPQCTRVYDDESLNFCLDDGTVLIHIDNQLTDENFSRRTEEKTEILPGDKGSNALPTANYLAVSTDENIREQETVVKSDPKNLSSQPNVSRSGVSPVFAYLTVGLLAVLVLIAGVALVVWVNSNSVQISNSNEQISKNLKNENESETSENKSVESNLNLTKPETSETVQKPKVEKEKTKTPSPEKTQTPSATPTPADGKYFVILGSFPQTQAARAKKRLQAAQSRGLAARIINTSNFPGLRSGLVAVVMGPFSKSEAQNALGQAKSVSGDAYIKAGIK